VGYFYFTLVGRKTVCLCSGSSLYTGDSFINRLTTAENGIHVIKVLDTSQTFKCLASILLRASIEEELRILRSKCINSLVRVATIFASLKIN